MANQNPQTEKDRQPTKNQESPQKVREFPDMQSQHPTERDARDLQGKKGSVNDTTKRNASEVGEGEDYDEDMLSNVDDEDDKDSARSDGRSRPN